MWPDLLAAFMPVGRNRNAAGFENARQRSRLVALRLDDMAKRIAAVRRSRIPR